MKIEVGKSSAYKDVLINFQEQTRTIEEEYTEKLKE